MIENLMNFRIVKNAMITHPIISCAARTSMIENYAGHGGTLARRSDHSLAAKRIKQRLLNRMRYYDLRYEILGFGKYSSLSQLIGRLAVQKSKQPLSLRTQV